MTGLVLAAILAGAGAPAEPSRPFAPPRILAPAAREASFGRVAGTVSPGTASVVVAVDGKRRATEAVRGRRFSFSLALPPRDVRIRVTAVAGDGRRASSSVRPVFGLPPAAEPAHVSGYEDVVLARKVRALARRFPGTSAVFVQDLVTGAGAAWNARARFPAGSTLKLPIAVEVLRVLRDRPGKRSVLGHLLHRMLVYSDNAAANRLETWLGGSLSGGAARVNATMKALGLGRSRLYGGFLPVSASMRRPIPVTVEQEAAFGVEKHTTAWDLARLHSYLHLAAGGTGPLVDGLRASPPRMPACSSSPSRTPPTAGSSTGSCAVVASPCPTRPGGSRTPATTRGSCTGRAARSSPRS